MHLRARRQKERVDARLHRAVGRGHLRFVIKVATRAQAAQNRTGLNRAAKVHGETAEHAHVQVRMAFEQLLKERDAFFGTEQARLGRVRPDRHRQAFKAFEAAGYQVDMSESWRVERSGEHRVAGIQRRHGLECNRSRGATSLDVHWKAENEDGAARPERAWLDVAIALLAGLGAGLAARSFGRPDLGAVLCLGFASWWIWREHRFGALVCFLAWLGTLGAQPATWPCWTYGVDAVGEWSLGVRRAGALAQSGTRPIDADEWDARAARGLVMGTGGMLARPGETVLGLESTPPMPFAGGLDRAPTRDTHLARLTLDPEALVRLAPAPQTLVRWLWERVAGPPELMPPPAWRTRLLSAASGVERAAELPHGLGQALWLGESSALDSELRDVMTRTGTRHLLAISGMHVALMVVFWLWPLARVCAVMMRRAVLPYASFHHGQPAATGSIAAAPASRRRWLLALAKRSEWILLCIGLLMFAGFAGGSAPVWRAAVVVALGLGASHIGPLGRRPDALNLWGAALTIELLAGTRGLASVSLQLSYAATLGLILLMPAMSRWLERALVRGLARFPGMEAWRPGWARAPWTCLPRGCARWVAWSLGASLVAVLATIPIAWMTFGEIAPIGVLMTSLCLVPVAWLLIAGWPLLLVASLGGPCVGWGLRPASELWARLLAWADSMPGTPILLPERPIWILVLPLILLAFGQLDLRQERRHLRARRQGLWRAGALIVAGVCLLPWSVAPPRPEVIALDVGHGTAVLIRTERHETWIFDAGSRDRLGVWSRALRPQLSRWESGAPYVVLSHGDRDHWNALPALVERLPPAAWYGAQVLEVEVPPGTPAADIDSGATRLRTGATSLTLWRGGAFHGNEGSRSLLVESAGQSLLLSGDAEAEGLRALLDFWPPERTVDTLLMPHHGSDTADLEAALRRWQPQRLWVSKSGTAQLEAEILRRKLSLTTTNASGALSWPETSK
jgi:ComEC/Rec2-related protein